MKCLIVLVLGTLIWNSSYGDTVLQETNRVEMGKGFLENSPYDWSMFLNPGSGDTGDTNLKISFHGGVESTGDLDFVPLSYDCTNCSKPNGNEIKSATGISSPGWTFYPATNSAEGESFIVMSENEGVGIYAASHHQHYRPSNRSGLIYQKTPIGSQGVGVSRNMDEVAMYPWSGNRDLRINIVDTKMKTSVLGDEGHCRFNFTTTLKCQGCDHPVVNLMVRSASTGSNNPKEGTIPNDDFSPISKQYNFMALKDGFKYLKHRNGSTTVAINRMDATAFAAESNSREMKIDVTFPQFKRILGFLAQANGAADAEEFYGPNWDDPTKWYVRGIKTRMEVTADDNGEKVRCGGKYKSFIVRKVDI